MNERCFYLVLHLHYYRTDSMLHTATLQYGLFVIWIDIQVRNIQTCIAVFVFMSVCLVDYYFGEIKAFRLWRYRQGWGKKLDQRQKHYKTDHKSLR